MDDIINTPTATKSDRDFLFQLLDDIDTADDMAHGDDAHYRKIVQRIQKRRYERATTDGYGISWRRKSDG